MSEPSGPWRHRAFFARDVTQLASKLEDQWFERKSGRVEPRALADVMVAFANAEGGTIVVGVEDDGRIVGIAAGTKHENALLQAAIEFTDPPVRHFPDFEPVPAPSGDPVRVLIVEVPPSSRVHRTRRGQVFQRVGDQSRELGFDATQELMYDRGEREFDATTASIATTADLDERQVSDYASAVDPSVDGPRVIRARNLVDDDGGVLRPTWSGLLLLGRNPEQFLPSAFVRLLRYDGIEAMTGARSNISLDRRIFGSLPLQIERATELLDAVMPNVTRLDPETGRFATFRFLPQFAWQEAIVNAVTHRSYSLQGDHIRVKLFDDRLEVESPGGLPGLVRIDNIRSTRFSRNPRIARALADLAFVRVLNEGVNRMYEEMALAGLPDPVFAQSEAGVRVTLYAIDPQRRNAVTAMVDATTEGLRAALERLVLHGRITTAAAAAASGVTVPTARRHLRTLEDLGWVTFVRRTRTDPSGFWAYGRGRSEPT